MKMALVGVNNLKKSFGEDVLFDKASFEVGDHDKIGLVGVNGTGKTTLFKIMTGDMPQDSGEITKSKLCKTGYMEQQVLDLSISIYDEMLSIFSDLMEMEGQIELIHQNIEHKNGNFDELINKQHILAEKYEDLGGLTYKSRARAALLGLGFDEKDFDKPVKILSGGQKSKLQLAKMLFCSANILLLDEPTNHLDIAAVEWLEDFLRGYSGAFIVISHDRYFLDRVTTRIFEIENQKLTVYSGNYSKYLIKKEEDKYILQRQYENTTREIKRIEGIIEQQRQWNREKNIKTAESKQKIIDRLSQDLEKPESAPEVINIKFITKSGGGNDVLIAKDLSLSFGDKLLFKNSNLHIKRGESVFLLGPNGCGKTSLFKIIMGIYQANFGSFKIGANIETGYYDQTQANLDYNKTIMDEVWDTYPKMTQTEIRNALAVFLFKTDDVYKHISDLSGGEKARVALLKLMLSGANFLLLDEPTNHLDITSREALEQAFASYDGTLFIISHDRYFINKMADRIISLSQNGTTEYAGNYDYYIEKYAKQEEPNEKKTTAPRENEYKLKKEKESAKRRLASQLSKTEQAIAEGEQELLRLTQLQNTEEYATDYTKALTIAGQIDELKNTLDDLFITWSELSEQAETQ
jgi:ATP-binding cassette subfamily F protein 3